MAGLNSIYRNSAEISALPGGDLEETQQALAGGQPEDSQACQD